MAIPLVYNKAGAYMHPFIFRKVSIMLDKIEKAGILEEVDGLYLRIDHMDELTIQHKLLKMGLLQGLSLLNRCRRLPVPLVQFWHSSLDTSYYTTID